MRVHLRSRKERDGEGGDVRSGREICHQVASDALWPLGRQYEELEGLKANVGADFHPTQTKSSVK